MRIYTVYATEFAPEALSSKYPNAAQYEEKKLTLFAESLEQVTGEPANDIVNLKVMGLQEDDGTQEGILTKTQLLTMVESMLAEKPTGREIQLSLSQGKYLYDVRFKPASNDI